MQSTDGSFGDPSTQRLAVGLCCRVLDELNQVSSFAQVRRFLPDDGRRSWLELLRICWIPDSGIHVAMAAKAPGLPENVVGLDGNLLAPSVPLLSRCLGFRRRLIRWLTATRGRRTSWDFTGQAHEPFSRGESTTHPNA